MNILPENIMNDYDNVDEDNNFLTDEDKKVRPTYKFDFRKGDFATDLSGNMILLENEKDIIKEIIQKILHDERYKNLAYSNNYGNEIKIVLEQDEDFEIIACELQRVYKEALESHHLIESITDFSAIQENDKIYCKFYVNSINGKKIYIESEVE